MTDSQTQELTVSDSPSGVGQIQDGAVMTDTRTYSLTAAARKQRRLASRRHGAYSANPERGLAQRTWRRHVQQLYEYNPGTRLWVYDKDAEAWRRDPRYEPLARRLAVNRMIYAAVFRRLSEEGIVNESGDAKRLVTVLLKLDALISSQEEFLFAQAGDDDPLAALLRGPP